MPPAGDPRNSVSMLAHQATLNLSLYVYTPKVGSLAPEPFGKSFPDELIDPARSFDSFRQLLKTILFSLY